MRRGEKIIKGEMERMREEQELGVRPKDLTEEQKRNSVEYQMQGPTTNEPRMQGQQ